MPHNLPAAQVSCDRLHRASDWEKPIGESQSHILRWWRLKNLSVRYLIPKSLNVKPEIKTIDWIEKNFLVFDPRLLSLANLLKPAPLIRVCDPLSPEDVDILDAYSGRGRAISLGFRHCPKIGGGAWLWESLNLSLKWFIKNQMIIWG